MTSTTIQISQELQQELNKMKLFSRETYEEIIWNIIEDTKELSEQAKKDIKQAEADIKAGKVYSHEQVKKELEL